MHRRYRMIGRAMQYFYKRGYLRSKKYGWSDGRWVVEIGNNYFQNGNSYIVSATNAESQRKVSENQLWVNKVNASTMLV